MIIIMVGYYCPLSTFFNLEQIANQFLFSTRLSKENIYGIRVPQSQISYICDTTHTSHKKLVGCVLTWIICGGETKSCNFNSGGI